MEIRVLHRRGMSIRAISRELKMSRKTVRKYLRAPDLEPVYRSRAKRGSKLDPHKDYLVMRIGEAAPRRLPATVYLREIQARGYEGGITILKTWLTPLANELRHVKRQILETDRKIMRAHRSSDMCQRLETIPGVGPVIATRVVAEVPDPRIFKSGRAFSAWVGLVPKQHSSGGRDRMGRITKTGNPELRRLLVAGAMSMIIRAKQLGFTKHPWLSRLLERKPMMVVAIAMANKIGRMIWALMVKGEKFNPAKLMPA